MEYDPNRKCLKCHRSDNYLFYCEDCGGTICNNCIISDKTECTFCSDCSHISPGNKCELCGKSNSISTAKKFTRKCPICTSMRIKDISEKISGLTLEYNDAIELIGNGLSVIKRYNVRFTELTSQARQLRKERFGLYPNIENIILRTHDQLFEVTTRANELLDKASAQISQDARQLKLNQSITVNSLYRIDKILKVIKAHALSYSNLIEDFMKDSNRELFEAEGYISEMKGYLDYFDGVSDRFEPEPLELKIAVFPNIKIAYPDDQRRKNGTLFITNKHLYFMPITNFIFKFKRKIKALPISQIRDVEIRYRPITGAKLLVNISNENQMKIKSSAEVLEKLNFIFGVLFNNNEGYVISDPYYLESFRSQINLTSLREKTEKRIKDLKQIPFGFIDRMIGPPNPDPFGSLIQDSDEIKQLQIQLKAAKDTLKQLIMAFDDRSITPEVYFSRREKTKQRILTLEDDLKGAMKEGLGLKNLGKYMNYYRQNQNQEMRRR
ncbi:MAG: hypothetical protein ACTSO7_09805 [Candidatus Heimdallarchaeota archaeon]